MNVDAEASLFLFETELMARGECKTDPLVVKYFIKALLLYDKYQLRVNSKTGFKQLLRAEQLDKQVLIDLHGGASSQTPRILLNMLGKFREYLTLEDYKKIAVAACAGFKHRPEAVINVKCQLALKHLDEGEPEKALEYII